jgi:hypothetical protein
MIYDLYSRRRRRELQQEPDVYQYDQIPDVLRGQIPHIWKTAIGPFAQQDALGNLPANNNRGWQLIHQIICREKGLEFLAMGWCDPQTDCQKYLKAIKHVDDCIDVIEVSFAYIYNKLRDLTGYDREERGITQSAEDAIDELNERFRQEAFGYKFENGRIIRVDSELVHVEVVKPALMLLSDHRFKGPQDEYLNAHEHYRAGRNAEAVTNANNAFESTMKVICDIKGWEYQSGARASDLVKIIRNNQLLPDYTEKSFDQLLATLQNGLPPVRNNAGGHGKGNAADTPRYIAAYAMHLAAADIVLMVDALHVSES